MRRLQGRGNSNMKKKIISIMLSAMALLTTLSGCGIADAGSGDQAGENQEGKVVNIYSWNSEFQGLYEAYAADLAEKHGVKVHFIINSSDNNSYQINLDNALNEQNEVIDDDKVDIFLIEADYAGKYTKSDYVLDVKNDIGLTDEDMQGQYQYTKDIVTVDNALKAVSWQATPGLFAYRRSIAREVLGTDDPAKVQEMVADWNKFNAVAEKMDAAGYDMLSGYDDSYRAFSNNVSAPWVVNGTVNIDPSIVAWIEQTKEFTDKGYNNRTGLWSPQWSKDQGPEGKVFGFFYSTWGINFTLLGNALADSDAEKTFGNGNFGDYAVCEGPKAYYWGGTWICGAKGSDNISFIKDLMLRLTCDTETMKQITLDTQDFTNNQKAMEEIAKSDYKSDFLGGQNHVALFAEAATKIDMSNASDYDKDMNEDIQTSMHKYFDGELTYEEALDDFYAQVAEKYPNLKR